MTSYSALANKFVRSSIFFEYRLPVFHPRPFARKRATVAPVSQAGYSLHDLSDIFSYAIFKVRFIFARLIVSVQMEMERFELLTPCLQGRCSPN